MSGYSCHRPQGRSWTCDVPCSALLPVFLTHYAFFLYNQSQSANRPRLPPDLWQKVINKWLNCLTLHFKRQPFTRLPKAGCANFGLVALTAQTRPVLLQNRHVKRRSGGRPPACAGIAEQPAARRPEKERDTDVIRTGKPEFPAGGSGHHGLGNVHYNLIEPALIEAALKNGEGTLGQGGAFLVTTGKFTGRSPKDKHVVKSASVADNIWWENNAAMSPRRASTRSTTTCWRT